MTPPVIPPFEAALFDAGQTLIRPVRSVEGLYARFAQGSGRTPEELAREIRGHFGVLLDQARRDMAEGRDGYVASDEADREIWRKLCFEVARRVPGLTDDPQAWFEALYHHFGLASTWAPFPEVETTLAELRERGIKLAVVSNWDSRLFQILEGLGLDQQVDAVVVSAREGVRKPSPRIFEIALERLGATPGRTIMVGDNVTDDIDGARRAGVTGVLVARGDGPGEVPDFPVIRSLDEILAALPPTP